MAGADSLDVCAPLDGIVAEVLVATGDQVEAGVTVVLIESMKMHHEVGAPEAGIITETVAAVGDQIAAGASLVRLRPGASSADPAATDSEPEAAAGERSDLAAAMARRAATADAARPEAIERLRERSRRSARENVADLCDPGSFVEYGGLAIAAQRARRPLEELIERTPGDGMVCGIGTINADSFGSSARCAVLSYDYTVLAGTQGLKNHQKTDRLLELAERRRLPVVLFAEGGGGRPGDTDKSDLFMLTVPTFRTFARMSGLVPRIGIASGRCFAGNAALLGCCDVVIATPDATIGMGGPAMIEGGGLGAFSPEQVGPSDVLADAGAIDFLAGDEAEAVATARQILGCFQGSLREWDCADQQLLRSAVPEARQRAHDIRALLALLADTGSVVELRGAWGQTILIALARIEGRAVGVIANDPAFKGGAIDAAGADKAARFIQLCDGFGLPIVSLVDTPGFMVGPDSEAEAAMRRCSRMFLAAATASVPFIAVVVRRAFGLGAQAMTGGSFHAPLLNIAWPSGEFGAMGVEGAVRLAMRRELDEIADQEERERRVAELVEAVRGESGALNMASYFEIDDVIDPAETRGRIVATLATVPPATPGERRRTMIDSW